MSSASPARGSVSSAAATARRSSLYLAQRTSRRDSPPSGELRLDALAGVKVKEIMATGRAYASFELSTPAAEVVRRVSDLPWQDVFPVVDKNDTIVGVITSE